MSPQRGLRKLGNVMLTRQFHWRYMGLWVILTIFLCLVFNIICYRLIEWSSYRLYTLSQAELNEYLRLRELFLIGTAVEAVFILFGVLALAMFTAHRVAGPYLRLCAAFSEVAQGNYDYRLKFRSYDHLQGVEDAFSRMMERVRADCARAATDKRVAADAGTGGK